MLCSQFTLGGPVINEKGTETEQPKRNLSLAASFTFLGWRESNVATVRFACTKDT